MWLGPPYMNRKMTLLALAGSGGGLRGERVGDTAPRPRRALREEAVAGSSSDVSAAAPKPQPVSQRNSRRVRPQKFASWFCILVLIILRLCALREISPNCLTQRRRVQRTECQSKIHKLVQIENREAPVSQGVVRILAVLLREPVRASARPSAISSSVAGRPRASSIARGDLGARLVAGFGRRRARRACRPAR